MRLVFINQYYPPDHAPTGLMLEAVANRLGKDGHDVTVLCGSGGYASGDDSPDPSPGAPGVTVRRVSATRLGRNSHLGRILDYGSFYAGVAWQIIRLRPRPDRIVALTTPPFLSILGRLLSKLRGGDHAHWVMDLYPDVMISHGMISERGLVARCLRCLTRWGFGGGRCAAVAVLGPDMMERIGPNLSPDRPAAMVPLWATAGGKIDERQISAWRAARHWGPQDLVLLYSGNMGLGHRFEEFLSAANTLGQRPEASPSQVRMVFTGGGKRRAQIEDFVAANPEAPVEVDDYVSREHLAVHLSSADLHLVSLEPAWDGTMVPSKLQGIFSIGRPVLFVGSRTCSIGRWILESGGGWVVEPGDTDGVLAALESAGPDSERRARGEAARAFAEANFDQERNVARLATVFGGGER